MNFGRTLKKALKRNDLPTDFATWNAIVRDRPRWRLLAHYTPSPLTPSPPTPSPPKPNQPPANPNAPLPGYGNLAPTYVVPTWYAPLAQAQYAETRATDRAARYAAHRARQLKKKILNTFPATSGCFVLGCQCFVARIYCDGQYFYWVARLVFGNKRGNK
jgi:hypothetical protein